MFNKSVMRILASGLMLTLATTTWAAKPAAPINIEADKADIQRDYSTYTGNVRITQGGVTLAGDRLAVRKLGSNSFELTLSGTPATIDQAAQRPGENPIRGRSAKVLYLSSSGILTLSGNAVLNRGGEEITGETIQYDWQARRTLVNNNSSSGGRVSITLQPGSVGGQ